jgi:uncharacterized membrane protein (UPF0182 family)
MYVLLILGILAVAGWIGWRGVDQGRPARLWFSAGILLLAFLFFCFLSFWGEMLWYESLGYAGRFWTAVLARVCAVVLGSALAGGGVFLLTIGIPASRNSARLWARLAGATGGAIWGLATWEELLLFLHRVPTGLADPILGRDTGFYLFTLPVLDRLYWLALWTAVLALAATLGPLLVRRSTGQLHLRILPWIPLAELFPVFIATAALGSVLAFGKLLGAFHLLYADGGVVAGAGWTDVHVRLPATVLVALLTLALSLFPLFPRLRRVLGHTVRRYMGTLPPDLSPLGGLALAVATLWLGLLGAIPALVQWLVVQPSEISFEMPYIRHNIEFTRRAFRLHEVEERQFPASGEITRELLDRSRHLLSEARLWDWRALDAVYRQFQEIRLYYEFSDVDMDRYAIGDRYRQVMISARELTQANLPRTSQTFVNRRFKYTHGYGLTLTTVSDFTPEGLPDLLVKDIPPRSRVPELSVERPQIYYGERTQDPALVNSREPEFDYPSGDENVYAHYNGRGGVPIRNLWRKFLFGWKFDGTPLLFSVYPTPETRIMFHRQIRERVQTLAPFLVLDEDPYIVLVDGRLYWIIDGYTTSRYYPYSEPFSSTEIIGYTELNRMRRLRTQAAAPLDGGNYVRNSVKVVVDAFHGTTDLYVFDPADPIVRAWGRAFPGLFKDRARMPAGLLEHVRYPSGFLLAQGLVYAKYHMNDPAVFYNQEDLWVRATEKYYADLRPVDPYYAMWQQPGSERAEFVLILPFTPKHRQVLIGWIAGLCDGANYGRFLAYKFPKERRVLGPQQVETKIDQDRFLSGQLTLWDQRGSQVIRGNVLALPIEDTLLYVEPIYLQAETAAYPELRLVIVMHGDRMSYAETFEEALEGLFDERPRVEFDHAGTGSVDAEIAHRANQAFEAYLRLQAEGRFTDAAQELERLRDLLQQLVKETE